MTNSRILVFLKTCGGDSQVVKPEENTTQLDTTTPGTGTTVSSSLILKLGVALEDPDTRLMLLTKHNAVLQRYYKELLAGDVGLTVQESSGFVEGGENPDRDSLGS